MHYAKSNLYIKTYIIPLFTKSIYIWYDVLVLNYVTCLLKWLHRDVHVIKMSL